MGINGKHDIGGGGGCVVRLGLQISERARRPYERRRRLKGNLLGRIIIGPTTMLLADGPFAAHKRHVRPYTTHTRLYGRDGLRFIYIIRRVRVRLVRARACVCVFLRVRARADSVYFRSVVVPCCPVFMMTMTLRTD